MKARWILFIMATAIFFSCYRLVRSSGGGQRAEAEPGRRANSRDIALPEGYQIEVVAEGLTFPTGIAFDSQGIAYVTEAGYSYGEVFKVPRLIRLSPAGEHQIIAEGENNGPWNGLYFHEGYFYIAEGGQMKGGRILRVDLQGNIAILLEGLPGMGDHHTNGPVVHDGFVYFGQGTATNSSVVGEDNLGFGWLSRFPDFHDIPCRDIVLAGTNYETADLLSTGSQQRVQTGAFLPFGTPSHAGQLIRGRVPCSGSLLRIPLQGGEPQLVAWGFRNPFGLAFDPSGQLFVTDNGYDNRGSRPVWGTGDYLWRAQQDAWYGWPDFAGGLFLAEGPIRVPGKGRPARILAEFPSDPPQPAAVLGVHSSSNGFDFSRSDDFGFFGEAFIAQFGDLAPEVGKVMNPVGFKVVRVNTRTGVVRDFAINKKENAPASKLGNAGLERPTAARFSPDGRHLYVVDFGVMLVTDQGPHPLEKTGVIWRISKTSRP